MTAVQVWQAVLWLVAFGALLRIVWALTWLRPRVRAAITRHPAGYRTRTQEGQP